MTSRPWTVLLSGTVGSHAYGLATPTSDVDTLSVGLASTESFLGFNPPQGKSASSVRTDPDITVHEVGKFLSLCLKANPTVSELLWLENYGYQHPVFGVELVRLRRTLLGARAVRSAYLGYATSQFHKMEHRGDGTFSSDTGNRTAKHARHLMRLLNQGVQLYTTGEMTVRVENPEDYHAFGQLVAKDHERGLTLAKRRLAEAEEIFDVQRSPLPAEPDPSVAEGWLIGTRRQFLESR